MTAPRQLAQWALASTLAFGAQSARADPAEFALGAELVRSIGHSSTSNSKASIPDAATWGVGFLGEARLRQGLAQLAIWGEVQTDLNLPYFRVDEPGVPINYTASYLPIELGLRPSVRLDFFEPHLGFIWTILAGPDSIYGLGGNLGADFRFGPVLVGFDFRASGLLGSGQPSSLYQGILSARLIL